MSAGVSAYRVHGLVGLRHKSSSESDQSVVQSLSDEGVLTGDVRGLAGVSLQVEQTRSAHTVDRGLSWWLTCERG